MFSSNPCSQVPSSINVFSPSNSFFDYEKDNDAHFNLPFTSNDFVCHPPPVAEDVNTLKQDFVLQQQQYSDQDLLESVISSYKKKISSSKRDGHSKIYTARGPRDRRVRLSIDVSRKFFCLQDLLGFDKASKTLDWLLTKSLTAIKDLVTQTNQCSSLTVTEESNAEFLETIKRDSDVENGKNKSRLKCVDVKGKKLTQRSKVGSQESFSREQSRAEARARARERTKEKSRLKNLVMDQETSKQLKDSSFDQVRGFNEQLGDHPVDDSDLDYVQY